jgi:hypothetical protein
MKALSLRQPWASLVVQGRKTLELRSWPTAYRGRLAIHASQTVDAAACAALGCDPDQLPRGALLGTVQLTAVRPLDAAAFQRRAADHLAAELFPAPEPDAPLFGWEVGDAQALPAPIPYRGRMSLFAVPDELLAPGAPPPPASAAPAPPGAPQAAPPAVGRPAAGRPFELRVLPAAHPSDYRLALTQRLVEPLAEPDAPVELRRVAELGGPARRAVTDQVLDALRQHGYAAAALTPSRREPFLLAEEAGVRLGLLFLALGPLSKLARIEAVAQGIRAMTAEELYYWYSKCFTPGSAPHPPADRARKALRVLLAEE